MIAPTAPPLPFLPFASASTHQRRLPVRNVSIFGYLQCSQQNANSLPLFASRTLYFHPLTGSFRKNRGVGYARPNNQMTSLFISLQKGKKPRIAWGEAIRGLGDNYEDWAVRSSLKLSVARPL